MAYYHTKYGYRNKKKRSRASKIIYTVLLIGIVAAITTGYLLYRAILKPNTWVKDEGTIHIHIPTGADYNDLKTILFENGIVINRRSFHWLAERKNLPAHVYPGRYLIRHGMSNDDLINLLRSGEQTPVNVIFNNIRTPEEFAQTISRQIEADSASIISLMKDSAFTSELGFDPSTITAMLIPNTYEVYWNVSADNFIKRMAAEHKRFWNGERKRKAEELGLIPLEVTILASIVEKETIKEDEKTAISGVYLNRLKHNWRLQADPTLVYAWGDFGMKRVLNIHKKIDSPYNTYKYAGLPPGPICVPSISSLEAVLNAEDHDYFFFCAKDDFSGYHEFAKTQAQHTINANRYRRALDERNIRN